MTTEGLLKEAKAAPAKFIVTRYSGAVQTLRVKGYSWREIAKWMKKHGVKVSHGTLARHFNPTPHETLDFPKMGEPQRMPDALGNVSPASSQ